VTEAGARSNLGLGSIATQNANAVAITGGSISNIAAIMIEDGGTGATSAAQARLNLGLGDVSTQSKNAVDITGGTITGITPLPVASGGTTQNAGNVAITGGTISGVVSSAAGLGLGTMADQNANAVAITGGSISGISALPVASGGTGAASAGVARTNLGLAIGSNVQAYNAILQAMANTSPVANTMIYFTSANTAAVTTITAYGRQVLEATSGSGGLGLGTMANQNANAVAITGGTISGLANALPVTDGGTGGINPFQARTNLGLGTMATQNANAVAITGGSISGLTTMIPIDSGGTGANNAANARVNLGLGTLATQNSDAVAITGTPTAPTAAANVSNTQIATTAFVRSIIPTGVITMWYGSVASVPSGWYLCDGTNGTPDLRSRFIVGAGTTYAVGAFGGSTDAIVVSHSHTASSTFTGSALGTHTHTATDSGHSHVYAMPSTTQPKPLSSGQPAYIGATATSTGNGYANISVTASSAGTPSGTVTTTVSTAGASGTNANLPPYYALAYIMKA
jgi:hypothetical protein